MNPLLPKLSGADVELGNFIAGHQRAEGTGSAASAALLKAMARRTGGVPAEGTRPRVRLIGSRGRGLPGNPQDSGRVFLPGNGGSVYIDLDHLELCLPEVRSAHEHVAAWHAMLRLAQDALADANADRDPSRRIQAMVNNSDGWGNSYGGHLNLLLSRPAWDGLMRRRLHHLAFLASYQASAVLFTGQGKVGSENRRPAAGFQLSQRADFIETLLGPQTTFFRPLVNTRDEPHSEHARLHLISFDTTLAEVACLLRVGVTQIILAMIEADRVNPALALDDPVGALPAWSADPALLTTARLASGEEITALDLQLRFHEEALAWASHDDLEAVVPGIGAILSLWGDTLERLARRDWLVLARRLDWCAKLAILERAMAQQPGLDWSSPEIKYLDHLYAGLDPAEGLFWVWSRAGLFERVVEDHRVRCLMTDPPVDTRAFIRAQVLRQAAAGLEIERVDWDRIRFRPPNGGPSRVFLLDDPLVGQPEWDRSEAPPAQPRTPERKPRRKAR